MRRNWKHSKFMESCCKGLKYALSEHTENHPFVLQDIGPLGPLPSSHSTSSANRWPCAILGWLVIYIKQKSSLNYNFNSNWLSDKLSKFQWSSHHITAICKWYVVFNGFCFFVISHFPISSRGHAVSVRPKYFPIAVFMLQPLPSLPNCPWLSCRISGLVLFSFVFVFILFSFFFCCSYAWGK